MYRKYNKSPRRSSDDSDVTIESFLEGGLLGPLTDIISTMAKSGLGPSLLKGLTGMGQNQSESFISNNRGVIVAKSTFFNMKRELLRQGQIYWDPEFPADKIEMPQLNNSISWKRPFEICPNPQMFTQGISRFDVNQGKLGDCWLLAAMACLVIHKNLFHQVVPLDQSFNRGDYCGMFRFHFWFFGQWLEIVIDDLLPTVNGKLVLMKSKDPCEFWSALLEKAYAKLYGSYKNLVGGFTSEAMVDFTAGIIEKVILKKNIALSQNIKNMDDLYFRLLHAFSQQSLMSCSKEGGLETRQQSGLVSRHAYSVTAVCLINTNGFGQARLIRLRNPWGNETEWKGAWSDGSQEWRMIPPQEMQRLQLINRDDGEFWMAFYDFVNQFDKMEICYIGPQCLEDLDQMKHKVQSQQKNWQLTMFYGAWRRGVNAGGNKKYNTYWNNPQFQIKINEPDDGSTDGSGTLIVGLMQRSLRFINEDFATIGYHIYASPNNPTGYFQGLQEVASSGTYINNREIAGMHKLFPGSYVIVPSTYNQNVDGQFLIRMFSVKKAEAIMIDQEINCNSVPAKIYPTLPTSNATKSNTNMQTDSKFINDLFNKYADSSRSLDPTQLQTLLNKEFNKEAKHGYLSLVTVQAFFYLMKKDYNSKIIQSEFYHIWWYLLQWKDLFIKYDSDKDGTFNTFELREALSQSGIQINNFILERLVSLYSTNAEQCSITFDNYVRCCVQLKSIFDQYQVLKTSAQFQTQKVTLEQFMDHCLRTISV